MSDSTTDGYWLSEPERPVVFMLSVRSDYITGQELVVDGGLSTPP